VPWSSLAEASYLLDRELGPVADAALFRSIVDGNLRVEPLQLADWARIVSVQVIPQCF
jgi:hypothetical protein